MTDLEIIKHMLLAMAMMQAAECTMCDDGLIRDQVDRKLYDCPRCSAVRGLVELLKEGT